MSLFDQQKKKGDSVKSLSETEIQSKLYGSFRKPHTEEPHPLSISESLKKNNPDPKTAHTTESLDLFSQSTSKNSSTDKKGPINTWLRDEQDSVQKHLISVQTSNTFTGKPAASASGVPGGRCAQTDNVLLKILKTTVGFFVGMLFDVLSFIFQTMRGKLSRLRRFAPLLGGVFFIVGLVFSIHSLNNQREKAMKTLTRSTPKKVSVFTTASAQSDKSETKTADPSSNTAKIKEVKQVSQVPQADKEAPSSAVDKPYVIQIATYINLTDAEAILEKLKVTVNLPCFIQSVKRQSGRTYHCVYIGRYETYEETEKALSRFKKTELAEVLPDAFIRSLK